jgi:NADH-quinone oxidoreductase subunit H
MYFRFDQWTFWITLIWIAAAMGAIMGMCAYLTLLERKIAAWTQDRVGPNRVGPFGFLQPIADGLKFLFKEEVIPKHVDKLFYLAAPSIALTTSLLAFAVVPFGATTPAPILEDRRTTAMVERSSVPMDASARAKLLQENKDFSDASRGPLWPQTETEKAFALAADRAFAEATGTKTYSQQVEAYDNTLQFVIAPNVDIGIVFVLAVGSLAAYAIVLGGWSSNNKYSFLGSLRSSAQLISYEIPMGMSVVGVVLISGSLSFERIIHYQAEHGWNFLFQPLAGLLFITSVFAECNRMPFDLPEAEQELVGGYHTEYSAMKFALFFLAEYAHMITTSFLVVIMFFGGWVLPGYAYPAWSPVALMIVKLVVFAAKMFLFIMFYMLIRWTIPRFRFDQLMSLAWKVMMPLALLNLVAVLVVRHYEISPWWLLLISIGLLVGVAAFSLSLPEAVKTVPVNKRRAGLLASSKETAILETRS